MTRIGLDVDGVLADFNSYCVALINRLFGTQHLPSATVEWDYDHLIPRAPCNTTVQRFPTDDPVGLFRSYLNQRGVCAALTPFPHARQLVSDLGQLGDVWLVTSPLHTNPTWAHERLQWAQDHLGIDRHRVMLCSDKSAFDGAVLVDDRAQNLQEWEDGGADRRGVLWKRPYSGPWAGWWVESPKACVTTVERALIEGGW